MRIIRYRRVGNSDAGKSAATAEIDPGPALRRQVEKLQRISDMAGPQGRQRGRRHQIGLGLPLPQQLGIAIEPRLCFT